MLNSSASGRKLNPFCVPMRSCWGPPSRDQRSRLQLWLTSACHELAEAVAASLCEARVCVWQGVGASHPRRPQGDGYRTWILLAAQTRKFMTASRRADEKKRATVSESALKDHYFRKECELLQKPKRNTRAHGRWYIYSASGLALAWSTPALHRAKSVGHAAARPPSGDDRACRIPGERSPG